MAAVGVPDEKSGEVVKVVIVKKDPAVTEADVRHWCEANLTGYKRPKLVEFRNVENQKVRREDQVNAILQDNPTYSLLRPRPTINALAGALLGLLVGGVVVFVLEYLESNVVRRREDLERALEIPVLASIPKND